MAPVVKSNRVELDGVITSCGFASGDRIVVGAWRSGPLGPMNDVMWARPDNTRVLVAPNDDVASFVSSIYEFDEVEIAPVIVGIAATGFAVSAGPVAMRAALGRSIPIPLRVLRPPIITRYVEGPIARRFMDVHTHGTTISGVEEWYRASTIRWIRSATATLHGVDLGAMTNVAPLRVGVSEPPQRPSSVHVRPLLKFE